MTLTRTKRLRPQSKGRAAERPARAATRADVFARDGHRCLLAGSTLGPCTGPLTPHHLWKEGQGGPYERWNLITLCAGHNGRVETMARADAVALGLVIERSQHVDSAWRRLAFAGIVPCWWDGSPLDGPPPVLDAVRPAR